MPSPCSACLSRVRVPFLSAGKVSRVRGVRRQDAGGQECAARAGLGQARLVLSGVSTLYFEPGAGDGFREPGFCRGLEPQITVGLRAHQGEFPLMERAHRISW